jgi:hypothetical protein
LSANGRRDRTIRQRIIARWSNEVFIERIAMIAADRTPHPIPPAAWALAIAGAAMVALLFHHPVVAHGTNYAGTLAALALPAGLGTALAAASGLHMHPHSLMLLTGVQALWYAGAALTLTLPPSRVSR